MKNALKDTAYLKQLNGRRLSVVERACDIIGISFGKITDSIDEARVGLTWFGLAVSVAARSMQGFIQEARDNAIAEQEK